MLKKQTVWLLTMLSLMIVLSIYYISSDSDGDFAYIDNQPSDSEKTATTDSTNDNDNYSTNDNGDAITDEITNVGNDELFTMIRMELQNKRSMKKSRYEEIIESSSASTDEKNEALNTLNDIDQISSKESILQNSILSTTDKYEDVLVRFDENLVHVHVKVDDLSTQEANHIMQMVKDEFGEIKVSVRF